MFPDAQEKSFRFWSEIDAVLVINLEQSTERWRDFLAETKSILPQELVCRVTAVPGEKISGYGERPWFRGGWRADTWAKRGGCVLSHRRALELARDRGWKRVLVLEDDVEFCSDFLSSVNELGLAMSDSSFDWDVIYLGFTNAKGPFKTRKLLAGNRHLAQIFGCHCAHAYIVNLRTRNWLLRKLPDESLIWPWLAFHRAIDRWLSSHLGIKFKIFAVSPPLINQRPGYSNILGRFSNDACGIENPQRLPINEKPFFYNLLYFTRAITTYASHAHNFLSACRKVFMGF
jgi:GR25 family glycosyltransferase involved in LPS biosynthesis